MKLGIALEGIRPAAELATLAARIEKLGFASLWTPDHVSYTQPISDPFQVLSVCAAATRRLTLGTCVYLLPLRHPTLVAKLTASFDWLSGGRLVLGIGVGGEFAGEFAACEVPIAERGARATEAIPIVRALWRGAEPPSGRFFRVPATRIAPAPLQPGGPPIWVGGRSEAALRRAAWLGDGYLGYFLDPPGVRARLARLRDLRAEAPDAERRGAPLTMAMQTFVRTEDDRERALARVTARLGAMYGAETERAAGRFAIVGTQEDCRRRLTELADAGVEHLICSPVVESDDLEEQLERLALITTSSANLERSPGS